MPTTPSKVTVFASVAGSAAIAATKFLAAGFSGSAAMAAEGIHSLIDTGNSALLYLGMRRAAKPPDAQHPFGYGMELYFWTLLVALLIFAVGGGVTIAEGVARVLKPHEMKGVVWNYVVLGISFVFNSITWAVALRSFWKEKGDAGFRQALERTKDPTVITVLFEDTASLLGLVIAFLGIFLGQLLHLPFLDGVASILFGVLLGTMAAGLVYQSKTLLVGESANAEVVDSIREMVEEDESVEEVKELLSMHLSPEDLLVNLKVRFRDGIPTRELERAVDRLEQSLRDRHTAIKRVFIEPGSLPPDQPVNGQRPAQTSATRS